MRLELKPDDKNFARLISTKQAVISSVFSTAARVKEAGLHRQGDNKLDEILAQLAPETVTEQ